MVIVEPTPRRNTAIVVVHNPLHALDIAVHEIVHLLGVVIRDLEFALKWLSVSVAATNLSYRSLRTL